MNILILGCGSIGKRHIKNLIKIGFNPKKITGLDPRTDRLNQVKKLGISTTSLSLKKLLKKEKVLCEYSLLSNKFSYSTRYFISKK